MNQPSREMCERRLRPGEMLRGPDDWGSPERPAFVVSVGYPEEGQAFNTFADGWGETPEAAWSALGWKLVERRVSGRLMWPLGMDHTPLRPTKAEATAMLERYRKSMSDKGYEYAKGFIYPAHLLGEQG